MSMEDLKRMRVLLDEKDWSPVHARCRMNVSIFVVTIIMSLIGCWLMIVGDGSSLTWLGVVLFIIGLFSLITVNLRGVKDVELKSAPSTNDNNDKPVQDENTSKTV